MTTYEETIAQIQKQLANLQTQLDALRVVEANYFTSVKVVDGVTAPSTISTHAQIYVDASGGDLKVKFGDGTVKTIVTDE